MSFIWKLRSLSVRIIKLQNHVLLSSQNFEESTRSVWKWDWIKTKYFLFSAFITTEQQTKTLQGSCRKSITRSSYECEIYTYGYVKVEFTCQIVYFVWLGITVIWWLTLYVKEFHDFALYYANKFFQKFLVVCFAFEIQCLSGANIHRLWYFIINFSKYVQYETRFTCPLVSFLIQVLHHFPSTTQVVQRLQL